MLDFSLTPQQEELRQKCRDFALKEILPLAWEYDNLDKTPVEVIKKAWEAGVVNGEIPSQYGGKGFGLLEGCLATEEFAAACPGIATSIFDNSLGMEPLLLCKNEEAKKYYFSKLINEFKLMCFGTSEPTMGSDVSGIRCRAKQDGDDWILNGTKYWITNGGIADYMSVFAT
ncbi:MAG: acyl-CoA dehydrogenase family protein, partial [Desulfatibacillaceae bacterium]|nr:acyl-CoA dehydrogenase family protein [Desulfatibacillaceae bacterium]